MDSIIVNNSENRINISLDKSIFNNDNIIALLKRLRYQEIIRKAEFSDQIENLADDINSEWWENNAKRFLEGTGINA